EGTTDRGLVDRSVQRKRLTVCGARSCEGGALTQLWTVTRQGAGLVAPGDRAHCATRSTACWRTDMPGRRPTPGSVRRGSTPIDRVSPSNQAAARPSSTIESDDRSERSPPA